MNKEKIESIIGFSLLGVWFIGYIVYGVYKLAYAPYNYISDYGIKSFGESVIIAQGLLLFIATIPMVKDLVSDKKWYNKGNNDNEVRYGYLKIKKRIYLRHGRGYLPRKQDTPRCSGIYRLAA